MENIITQLTDSNLLIGCQNCVAKGWAKKTWLTLGQSFDLSLARLARRNRSGHRGQQVCIKCGQSKFYCYAVKGVDRKANIPLAWMQDEAIKHLDFDAQIDREALTVFMRFERLTSFPEAIETFQKRFVGTWRHYEEFALDWLSRSGLLENIPEEIRPFIDLEAWVETLNEKGHFDLYYSESKIFVFLPKLSTLAQEDTNYAASSIATSSACSSTRSIARSSLSGG